MPRWRRSRRHERDVGEAGGIVDDDLEVFVADGASPVAPPSGLAEHAMPAAVGDAPELLVVLVDELAGTLAHVAHRHPRGPVGVAEPAEAVAGQHRVHGRAGMPGQRADPVRYPASLDPRAENGFDPVRRGDPRRAVRAGAAILEPGPALGDIGPATCGPSSGSRLGPPPPWRPASGPPRCASPAVAARTR